ncbi:MAG: hypothetical protein ABJG88_07735 [Litorimonas sp.]
MSTVINADKDVRNILYGICDLTLPKAEWTHEAHFAAAIAMLLDSSFDALNDMPRIIKAYNEATGVQNTDHEGYHHTITMASLLAAKAVINEGSSSLSESFHRLLNSKYGKSRWVLSYWSKDLLFSVEARKSWLEPDLKKLPFKMEGQ